MRTRKRTTKQSPRNKGKNQERETPRATNMPPMIPFSQSLPHIPTLGELRKRDYPRSLPELKKRR
jgi:hypothetical protein